MATVAEVEDRIQFLLLKEIISELKNESLSIPDAKQVAIEYFKMEPFASVDEMRVKVAAFCTQHGRFQPMLTHIDNVLEEEKIGGVIAKMNELLKQQKVDEALEVAAQSK